MTIREELKEVYQKHIANWRVRKDKNEVVDVEAEARKFIEEVLIFKFREIAAKKPFCNFLFIEFMYGKNFKMFFSNVDPLVYFGNDNSISKEVMEKASELAKKEYDISTVVEEGIENKTRYMFYLELS